MYQYQEIQFLLFAYVLTDVACARVRTPPYLERIKSNATFTAIIENALSENKYISEECTGILSDMGIISYHVKHCIDLEWSTSLIDVPNNTILARQLWPTLVYVPMYVEPEFSFFNTILWGVNIGDLVGLGWCS